MDSTLLVSVHQILQHACVCLLFTEKYLLLEFKSAQWVVVVGQDQDHVTEDVVDPDPDRIQWSEKDFVKSCINHMTITASLINHTKDIQDPDQGQGHLRDGIDLDQLHLSSNINIIMIIIHTMESGNTL